MVTVRLSDLSENFKEHSVPAKPRSGTLYLVIIGLALALLGGVFVYLLGHSYLEAKETRQWAETPCLILESGVEERKLGENVATEYRHKLLYGYEFDNAPYTGEHEKRRENPWSKDPEAAEEQIEKYPEGSQQICFVNPKNPAVSVLAHDSKAAGYSIWFPGLFVVGGLGIVVGALRKSFSSKRQKPSS